MKAGNIEYNKAMDLPEALPMLLNLSVLVLPGTYLPVIIENENDINLVEDSFKGNKLVGVLHVKQGINKSFRLKYETAKMGCIARITSISETGTGKISISLEGICRFTCLRELQTNNNYPSFYIDPVLEDFLDKEKFQVEDTVFKHSFTQFIYNFFSHNELLNNSDNNFFYLQLENIKQTPFDQLLNSLCINCGLTLDEQQLLLEAKDLKTRAGLFIALIEKTFMKNVYSNKLTLQ